MEEYILGVVEGKFADIIWRMEPITMSELIKVSEKELGWKRTTTYTVLKKLSKRNLFQNENGIVVSLISKKEFYARQSERYVENSFKGSLPSFLAAFTSAKKLTKEEQEEIKAMIESLDTNEAKDLK